MSNFIVDGILDKKITHGTVYYKVKWAEHLPSSWEPEENFINCEALLTQFNKNKYVKAEQYLKNGNINIDIPLRIIQHASEEDNENNLSFLVEWRERSCGFIPPPSIVYSNDLKKLYPNVLAKYYEKCLIFK